jgi:hypothetical protein
MIPPFLVQLPVLGPTLYGEFCFGLCRALAAPWLGVSRLPPHGGPEAAPSAAADAAPAPVAATPDRSADDGECQVIRVPDARWRRGARAGRVPE